MRRARVVLIDRAGSGAAKPRAYRGQLPRGQRGTAALSIVLLLGLMGCQSDGTTGLNIIVEGCSRLEDVSTLEVTLLQAEGTSQQQVQVEGGRLPVQFQATLGQADSGRTMVEIEARSADGRGLARSRADAHVLPGQLIPVSVDLCQLLLGDGGPDAADGDAGSDPLPPDAPDAPDALPDLPVTPDPIPPPDVPPVDAPPPVDLGFICGDQVRVDILRDAENCGACGHICREGPCQDGRCVPRVIATSALAPVALALDQGRVVWLAGTTDGQVLKVDKEIGGDPLVLASPVVDPLALAVLDSEVFWISGTSASDVSGVNGEGGLARPLASGGPYTAIAAGLGVLVVARGGASPAIQRVALDGSGAVDLATGFVEPAALAVGRGSELDTQLVVYAARPAAGKPHGLLAVDAAGGVPETIVNNAGEVLDVALDEAYVYWVTRGGQVSRQLKPGGFPPPAGEAPTRVGLLGNLGCTPQSFALDSDFIYFACDTGVGRLTKGGPPLQLLDLSGPATDVAVDSQYVYWQSGVELRRLAK